MTAFAWQNGYLICEMHPMKRLPLSNGLIMSLPLLACAVAKSIMELVNGLCSNEELQILQEVKSGLTDVSPEITGTRYAV